ncbi:MAG: NYN domain-containing protein [Planctomycetota bacterium]
MLLIDVYNVLHAGSADPRVAAGLAGPMDTPGLARLLAASRYRRRARCLVCDGAPGADALGKKFDGSGKLGQPQRLDAGRIRFRAFGAEVLYAGGGRSADDLIEAVLADDPGVRDVLVVSSDRRLQRSARRRRAASITSQAFLRQLVSDSEGASRSDLPGFATDVPLDAYSVAHWLSAFGYEVRDAPELAPEVPKPTVGPLREKAKPAPQPAKKAAKPRPRGMHREVAAQKPTAERPKLPTGDGPAAQHDSIDVSDPLLRQALEHWRGRLNVEDLDMRKWIDAADGAFDKDGNDKRDS